MNTEPMSAEEVLSTMERCQAYVDDAACFPAQFKPGVVKRDQRQYIDARAAVAAMAEREAETSRALTASLNVVKRLQAERDALAKEVEALRAGVVWLRSQIRHSPLDHDLIRDVKKCAFCKRLASIDAASAEARDG